MKKYTWIGFLLLTFGVISYEAMTKPVVDNHRIVKPGQRCSECHPPYDICLPPCIK